MTLPLVYLELGEDPDGPEGPAPPSATAQSQDPHQWYITSTTPPATISIGKTHGPTGNGVYIATTEDGFVSSTKSMAIQTEGPAAYNAQGPWLLRVNDATTITTTATVDVKALSNITLVAGEGQAAVFAATAPGAEGGALSPNPEGDVGGGNGGIPPGATATSGPLPSFPANAPPAPGPGDGGHSNTGATGHVGLPIALVTGGLAIAEGVGALKTGAGVVGKIGEGAAGLVTGVATIGSAAYGSYATAQVGSAEAAAAGPRSSADAAAAALPPGADAAGGGPNIDMTAAEKILGKAQTGIAWYTPAAIKSTADTLIQNQTPIIRNLADVEIVSNAGVFIKNHAGTQIRNEAGTMIENSTMVWKTTGKVSTATTAFVSNSNTGFVTASLTGLVGASVTGVAICKVSSMGMTAVTGNVVLKLEGATMKVNTVDYDFKFGQYKTLGAKVSEKVATAKRAYGSVKDKIVSWTTKAATAKVQSPSIKLGP